MIRIFAICVFLFCSIAAWAQNESGISPVLQKRIKEVRLAMDQMDWSEAKKLSGNLIKKYPDTPEVWKLSAEVFQGAGENQNSEKSLQQLVRLDSVRFPEAYLWIAEWTFERGDYQNASVNFNRYFSLKRDTANIPYRSKLLHSSIHFALNQVNTKPANLPEKLHSPINTVNDEYFPSLSVDGSVLAFTRQTEGMNSQGVLRPQEDLLFANNSDTGYLEPQPFPYPINTPGNEGTQSLRQDGRIMLFTACNRPDTKGGCDIYYSVKSGDQWSVPVNLGNPVNSRYWESTPFLASDGKQLFFASNRPGGFGGMDIWRSVLKPDKSWSNPENLGSPVNTPLDEMSPFLLVDGRSLFFASNGHPGMGGFDLFKFDLSRSGKSNLPENLGFNINTYRNEDALTVNASTNLGLFASDRDLSKDIFSVDLTPFIELTNTLTLAGRVKDIESGLPLGAQIEVEPHGDSIISQVESDPVTGNFLLGIPERPSFRIGATLAGYLPFSEYYLNDSLTGKKRTAILIEMRPIKQGATIVLENIFFALDSYELLPESGNDIEEIRSVFTQNPGISIEISGFTDSTGSDEYNLVLSRKRAESVMKALIDKGINPSQITAKGYGRSNPVAGNETEEGRRLNRRTELKVIRLK